MHKYTIWDTIKEQKIGCAIVVGGACCESERGMLSGQEGHAVRVGGACCQGGRGVILGWEEHTVRAGGMLSVWEGHMK